MRSENSLEKSMMLGMGGGGGGGKEKRQTTSTMARLHQGHNELHAHRTMRTN